MNIDDDTEPLSAADVKAAFDLCGLRQVLVSDLRDEAAIVWEYGLILIREGLPCAAVREVAAQTIKTAVDRLCSNRPARP